MKLDMWGVVKGGVSENLMWREPWVMSGRNRVQTERWK